jgi:hypothetical protein
MTFRKSDAKEFLMKKKPKKAAKPSKKMKE